MSIDLREYSGYLELLYNDRMDIASGVETVASDGSTLNKYPDVPQQRDIPCKVSQSAKDVVEGDVVHEPVKLNPTIFCSTDIQVKAGDRITIRKCHPDGTVYDTFEGLLAETGRPNKFATHQEFELKMDGDA